MSVVAEGEPVPETMAEVAAQKASDPPPPDPAPQPDVQAKQPPDPTPAPVETAPPETPPTEPGVPPLAVIEKPEATAVTQPSSPKQETDNPPPPPPVIPPQKQSEPEKSKVLPKPQQKLQPQKPAKEKLDERLAQKAQKIGLADGKSVETGMTKAAYSAIINAQINEHRFYPESARAAGITGHVIIGFTIGPNGTATGVTIVKSSGNSALDEAARQAVRAVHAPPPPGGPFTASKSFNFNLN